MGSVRIEVEIEAPLDRVFVFFVPQRMPLWYVAEMDTQIEVQGGASDFHPGQKVRISGSLAGREVTLTAVVMRYDWMRALEWRFQDAYGVRGRQLWEIAEAPRGTRVTMHDDYQLPGRLGRWLDGVLMRPGVARRNRNMLASLKRLAEAKPRS
jgi:uncharacterized protein YndB with AHSA1/START domain